MAAGPTCGPKRSPRPGARYRQRGDLHGLLGGDRCNPNDQERFWARMNTVGTPGTVINVVIQSCTSVFD